MRSLKILISLFFSVTLLSAYAQISDPILIKKLSVNGYCLCKTTIADLKQVDPALKQVEIEEMDLAKGCYGQDSRFFAGKGYQLVNNQGLVFQKDQQTDYISKIRLTKDFKGNLPDGKYIDLSKLLLSDLFKLYPEFKSKWGSRGCSDYWNFSNDTISFFVKIDKSKQPQFPIDEAYYLNKPIEGIDLVVSCFGLNNNNSDYHVQVITSDSDPVYFIDSVRVDKATLLKYDPNIVASVTVYKDANAIKLMGEEAKNGLIYIESKQFAKKQYRNYFKSKSVEYANLILSTEDDDYIQYIINKRVLGENSEGTLAAIDDKVFKSIRILNKDQLQKEYGISNKKYGVVITSDVPTDLHNGKSKF